MEKQNGARTYPIVDTDSHYVEDFKVVAESITDPVVRDRIALAPRDAATSPSG